MILITTVILSIFYVYFINFKFNENAVYNSILKHILHPLHFNSRNTTYAKEKNTKIQDNKRYVFIDLGARNGDTIDQFLKYYLYNIRTSVEIYAFEANPENYKDMVRYKSKYPELNMHVINKAAWIHANGVNFTVDTHPTFRIGGSIFHYSQPELWDMKSRFVESVDFPVWLTDTVCPKDHVYVKMDIEGAEFEIIDKMLNDGSINLVDILAIEWHGRFMKNTTKRTQEYYVEKLKEYKDIKLKSWH